MPKTSEEMLELAERATPGPWTFEPEVINPGSHLEPPSYEPSAVIYPVKVNGADGFNVCENNNAQFIAASREFVPYAAKRLIEAEKVLKEAQEDLESCFERMEHNGMTALDIIGTINKIKHFLEANK